MKVKSVRFSGWLSLIVILSLAAPPSVLAQSPTPVPPLYFSATGHNVVEPFASFFITHGGQARFGNPITEAFDDSLTGLKVQYFQKARLEWHPGNPDPYKVQLGLLGQALKSPEAPLAVTDIPSPSDPGCQYFLETGHKTCFRFLEYWRANGGLDLFGYPIARPGIEGGRMVQYFQRARLEWHPEQPEGQRVQAASVGQIYYDFAHLDRGRLRPVEPFAAPAEGAYLTSLRATANLSNAVVARGGTQTVTVIVQDQLGRPVPGADVTLTVYFPTGPQKFGLPVTNADGRTDFSFPAGKFRAGTVVAIHATINLYNLHLQTETRTSYLMWYF